MLDPKEYFSFENLPFSPLLEEKVVWNILKNISTYLKLYSLGKIEIPIPQGVYLENKELISIGKNTILEPGVYIKGPALIGNNCQIRHGAYIRENVILADESLVGHCSEVKNSILLPRAHVAHFNYVGDSILGSDTNLGAGVKCANFRMDGKEIVVWIQKEKKLTGLRKFGLILGDRSQIGCNSVTNPGTLIGKGVLLPPASLFKGFIDSTKEKDG
jgi:NDP-sugar pyrophosphorylase family protein